MKRSTPRALNRVRPFETFTRKGHGFRYNAVTSILNSAAASRASIRRRAAKRRSRSRIRSSALASSGGVGGIGSEGISTVTPSNELGLMISELMTEHSNHPFAWGTSSDVNTEAGPSDERSINPHHALPMRGPGASGCRVTTRQDEGLTYSDPHLSKKFAISSLLR